MWFIYFFWVVPSCSDLCFYIASVGALVSWENTVTTSQQCILWIAQILNWIWTAALKSFRECLGCLLSLSQVAKRLTLMCVLFPTNYNIFSRLSLHHKCLLLEFSKIWGMCVLLTFSIVLFYLSNKCHKKNLSKRPISWNMKLTAVSVVLHDLCLSTF